MPGYARHQAPAMPRRQRTKSRPSQGPAVGGRAGREHL